jgi:hypothetical protein
MPQRWIFGAAAAAIALSWFLVHRTQPQPTPPLADSQETAAIGRGDAAREPVPSPELKDQRRRLLAMPPAEAREWILRELDGGADHPTGDDLSIGTDRKLTAWPSYRTFLLDLLFQIDPAVAAQKSRELVGSSDSPDEWAVALRNVARADGTGESSGWLREKSAELLRNKTWRADPSAGYLNAFDVIVHTEHTALAPELLALCDDPERRAVRHASFLAVDRLTQARPEVLLPVLADSAASLRQSGPMISNLMARADLRDEVQRGAVERYLLDPRRSTDELASFASVFPNANFHVSNNLLTEVEGIDGFELAERDRAALEVVRDWMADERFAERREALARMQARLEGFVNR